VAGVPTRNELFDPEIFAEVQRLRIVARRVPQGGRFAEQRSRARGTGIEFEDHRPYAAGDDLRTVDWHLYRRFGRVFLRLFEEQQDLPLYVLPDVSRSLFLEQPARVVSGLRCALALIAIGLGQHDTVGAFPFSDHLDTLVPPQSGSDRLMHFADRLSELEPGGETDFVASLQHFSSMRLRPGLVVVVSDFFDPGGIEAVRKALKVIRHRLLLVQLTRTTDRDPGVEGDLRLEDCETGAIEDVSVTGAVLARYRAAYDRWQGALLELTRSSGAGLIQVDVDRPVIPQLAELFEAGRYTA